MYKNAQTNPKNSKIKHNTPVVLCWHEKILKAIRGNGYRFAPKVARSLPKPSRLLWEALVCEKLIPKPTNGRKKLPQHIGCHSMIACQVSWISDEFWIYENLKTRYLNVCARVTVAGCLTFFPVSCMGPKHAPKDIDLIFQPIYMHWSMCM